MSQYHLQKAPRNVPIVQMRAPTAAPLLLPRVSYTPIPSERVILLKGGTIEGGGGYY